MTTEDIHGENRPAPDRGKVRSPNRRGFHVERSCSQPPSRQLLLGIQEFNCGAYFACHETLETLWVGDKSPFRRFYQGILQIAAALLHLERGNYQGAVRLLAKGAGHLTPFAPFCRRVNVVGLLRETERLQEEIEALGPERFREWNRRLTPRVRLSDNAPPGKW